LEGSLGDPSKKTGDMEKFNPAPPPIGARE